MEANGSVGTRVERDIAYGADPAQRYDVYLPAHAKPNAPILFMVHGGGWRRGDKAYANVVEHKAAHWLSKGYVFVSANNRLLPQADPLQQARDVAAAVASIFIFGGLAERHNGTYVPAHMENGKFVPGKLVDQIARAGILPN